MTVSDRNAIEDVRKSVAQAEDGLAANRPIPKVTGSRHLGAAFGYSVGGALRLFHETAFRHEIIAGIVIFCLFALVGAGLSDYAMITILMLGLVATEALNTAIEEIVDRVSPEWSDTGRNAKDLGSFAVFCMLGANGVMAAFVVVSRLISV
jgi:diacylglycerol kinase (ATP)